MALLTDTIQIKVEPYDMAAGAITALKITKISMIGTSQPEDEILEINPIPFGELGNIINTLERHYKASTVVKELKEQYDVLKEECRRTKQELQTIIKKPSIEETAERLRQEMEQSINIKGGEERRRQAELLKLKEAPKLKETPETLIVLPEEKPAHEETTQPQEPETPCQQAERIYDKVFSDLKGKKVEKEDIMASVMRAGIRTDYLQQVTEETINLLKEKGAIPSPKRTLKRLLGGGKKEKKEKMEK